MPHKNYWKIYSIDKEECEWILNWTCYIQEKIDWANLSVWKENWEIFVWSRTQTVWTDKIKTWFRWAVEYINNHQWIRNLFYYLEEAHKTTDIRLYGERLIPHTITNYNKENYNHFYLFDIEINWERIDIWHTSSLALEFSIKAPFIYNLINNPTKSDLDKLIWQSKLWPNGEWIVIKNPAFINKFWNRNYAKMVHEKFKEDNWVIFWNQTKHDNEQDICAKYCDWERVRKIMNKIEQNDWVNIEKKHIAKILWMVWYDIITEEANNISKYWVVDFNRLKWFITKKTKLLTLNHFDWWEVSVVFNNI
jgi:hypothetical protein